MTNVHDRQNISGMWQEHYSQIINVDKGSCSKELHADLYKEHSALDQGMRVNAKEI